MRVFILCTGRTGSVTLNKACEHITNFTSGHETRARIFGPERLAFPDNHIEIDNRLIWFAGELADKYAEDETFWVHLKRDEEKTAKSYLNRIHVRTSIVRAFAEGIYLTPFEKLNKEKQLTISQDYVRATNANIRQFLSGRKNTMEMNLESLKEDFREFWNWIGAEGQIDNALQAFETSHNASNNKKIRGGLKYTVKLFLLKLKRRFF